MKSVTVTETMPAVFDTLMVFLKELKDADDKERLVIC